MVMKKKNKAVVFLVGKFETSNNKHQVSASPTGELNRKGNTKNFARIGDAKAYAEKRARKFGLKEYNASLPSGHGSFKVSKIKKRR